jgi:hypothetical protein
MNLLDKYVEQLGKHLPRKNRLDLQAEIRSTIEDMLEDRSQSSGRPVDDALIAEVLTEYGSPEKVAAGYKPTRYLIGPRLYPFFRMVVRIVFAVLSGLALVGFLINLSMTGVSAQAVIDSLGKYGLQFLSAMISAFGNIVLVFAIIERVKPETKFEEEDEKWTPADLNAEGDPDRISRPELIFEILFTVLGLVVLNLYPNLIGIAAFKNNVWIFFPALSEEFYRYMPWINLLGGLQIVLDLYLMREELWSTATRWIALAIEVGGIVLAGMMLAGPAIVNFDNAEMGRVFGEAAGTIQGLFTFLPRMVLIILIIVQTVEAFKSLWKLINRRSSRRSFLAR